MSHTVHDKAKLLGRVRRVRGQLDAVERALEAEESCAEVMRQIASARGAMNGLLAKVVEDHIRTHLVDPENRPGHKGPDATDELVEVVHSYFK